MQNRPSEKRSSIWCSTTTLKAPAATERNRRFCRSNPTPVPRPAQGPESTACAPSNRWDDLPPARDVTMIGGEGLAVAKRVRIRLDQNFTSKAVLIRVSDLTRSGEKPGTSDPAGPELPPGGVTPPGPAKYGTVAARRSISNRKVANCFGMKSKVSDASQARNGSPGFSVK